MRERLNQTCPDRVADHHHKEGDGFGMRLKRLDHQRSISDEQFGVELDKLRREFLHPVDSVFTPSPLDRYGFAVDISEFFQSLDEGFGALRDGGRGARKQNADFRDFFSLLCAHRRGGSDNYSQHDTTNYLLHSSLPVAVRGVLAV